MNKAEIVEQAIEHLNKAKHTDIVIIYIEEMHYEAVRITVYFRASNHQETFNFNHVWFDPKALDLQYIKGFKLPANIKDPDKIALLKIAYYLFKTGSEKHWF